MSVRIQVILNEEELARFKQQAKRNSKSLSAWMRDAANKALQQEEKQKNLTSPSVIICRNGKPIAELIPWKNLKDPLKQDDHLKGVILKEDPSLPLDEDERPINQR